MFQNIEKYFKIQFSKKMFNFFLENHSVSTEDESQGFDAREEPDGEETISRNAQPQIPQMSPSPSAAPTLHSQTVKVPNWIMADTSLEVLFNERATQQINEFQINRVSVPETVRICWWFCVCPFVFIDLSQFQANIVEVLKNDPRSVYLKTRYGSQIFTFQLGEVQVTCKFNDANGVVTVVQIRKSENLSSETSQNDANAN